MSDIDAILKERQKTHGSFNTHADVTQKMKRVISPFMIHMSEEQREALEMILHKIGRIASGNPNHKDHWDDIAGYATLASRSIKEV